jgi:hypothetical protein
LAGLLNATSAANLTSVCSAAKLCNKRMVYAPCLGGGCNFTSNSSNSYTSYPNGSYPYPAYNGSYNGSYYYYYGEPACRTPALDAARPNRRLNTRQPRRRAN